MRGRLIIAWTLLTVSAVCNAQAWEPDVLGGDFQMRYVDQGRDYLGDVRCTLVRLTSGCAGRDSVRRGVLYVHGFNDYFFQKEMAEEFGSHCYDFYAVDLRRYGRSMLDEGKNRYECRSMREYFADIDSALASMRRNGIDDIVLMGHSTGGLLAAYYVEQNPGCGINALVLNSPFLDWNLGKMEKLVPLVSAAGALFPRLRIKQGDSTVYCQSLDSLQHGEWNFNRQWKLCKSPDVTAGWVRAIDKAQRELKKHPYSIRIPILLMYSSQSYSGSEWSPGAQKSDAVLDVKDIKGFGVKLGTDVTAVRVNGGLHDLILSDAPVREAVYRYLFSWLGRNL